MFTAPQEQEAIAPMVLNHIGASVKLCAADTMNRNAWIYAGKKEPNKHCHM